MKGYLKFFRVPFIIIAVVMVVTIIVRNTNSKEEFIRTNTECDTTERVFDYADKLTDSEETNLREYIAEKEKEVGCDIVIITLDESLEDYAAQYEDIIGPVPISECVMVYADNFFDEHKLGFNKPYGDGVVFLDNWYRESDGGVYSWMTTGGKVFDTYSSEMIDDILNDSLSEVDDNPYKAYREFVRLFAKDMSSRTFQGVYDLVNPLIIFIAAVIVAAIFLFINWSGEKGEKTVTAMTYLAGDEPRMTQQSDTFLYKNVTQRHIERSSGGSSGGGGGHRSAGGHSYGGGGHRR